MTRLNIMKTAPDLPNQSKQTLRGLIGLVERITPWLADVGSWIFAGLIALNLIVIAALITLGPLDIAVLVSVAAFACALPLDVAGIILLRLIKDVQDIRIDDLALDAFREAQFPDIEAYFTPAEERERHARRRARIILVYAVAIGALSLLLSLIGIAAALWHLAPWLAGVFGASVVFSAGFLLTAIVHSLPAQTEMERELKRRYRD